jgi:hypothetical protein
MALLYENKHLFNNKTYFFHIIAPKTYRKNMKNKHGSESKAVLDQNLVHKSEI